MGELKLFVVGQESGNPDEWTELIDYSVVIARDEDDAAKIAGLGFRRYIIEISLESPRLILSHAAQSDDT